MSRLTDERLAEILRPKEIIGRSEIQSLAREVRELRAERERLKTLTQRDSDMLRGYTDQIVELTSERDSWKATAESMDAENNRLASDVYEANGVIKTLTRELAEARDLLRRFRACGQFHGKAHDGSTFHVYQQSFEDCCQFYDTKFCQPQQPEPAGELVPWTAETRPRGTVWVRFRNDPTREWLINYWSPEYFSDSSGDDVESFADALEKYEWSRDGITWQRCGVVR